MSGASRMRRMMVQATYGAAVTALSVRQNIDPVEVLEQSTDGGHSDLSTVRQQAIYLTVVGLDVSYSSVAEVANVSKQAVFKALRRVEDDREDPELDAELDRLSSLIGLQKAVL